MGKVSVWWSKLKSVLNNTAVENARSLNSLLSAAGRKNPPLKTRCWNILRLFVSHITWYNLQIKHGWKYENVFCFLNFSIGICQHRFCLFLSFFFLHLQSKHKKISNNEGCTLLNSSPYRWPLNGSFSWPMVALKSTKGQNQVQAENHL